MPIIIEIQRARYCTFGQFVRILSGVLTLRQATDTIVHSRNVRLSSAMRMLRMPFSLNLGFLALVILLGLAGCADERVPPGKIKLVVWGLQFGEETKGLDAKVREFQRRHPNIVVSVLSMGSGQMNPQKLMTAIVGNVPPDVIHQDRFPIGDWASRETFIPLDDFILRDANDPYAIRERDYYKPCWAEATYKGRVFAIPSGTDDRCLYYNRTLFRQAGLDPDKPPRTWDELKDFAERLTVPSADRTTYKSIGFIPNYGNSWLYMYSWANGAEFMSMDGKTCTMNNPYSVEALKYMVDMYDMMGGVTKVDAFASGFESNDLDPFLTGKVAMKIDGNWVLNNIARFGPDLDFGVVAAPVPAERLLPDYDKRWQPVGVVPSRNGIPTPHLPNNDTVTLDPRPERFKGQPEQITWSGGYSFAIPTGAQHPQEGWEFIKWMTSPEAAVIEATAQEEFNRSKDRPFVPNISANIRTNEAVLAKFPPKSEKFRKPLQFFVDMMPYAKFRPVTFVGQRLWDEHARAFEQATHHKDTGVGPKDAMDDGTRVVQTELEKAFHRGDHPLLDQRVPVAIAAFLGLALISLIFIRFTSILRMGQFSRREALAGYIFVSPWLLGFLILTVGPIVTAVFLSFCDYDVLHPPRYVGALNYVEIFGVDRYYLVKSLSNVIYLAVVGIPLGICTGLSIAMLLNSKVGGMSVYRTFFYVPAIVPVVASAVLWAWVLNGDANRGLLNAMWKAAVTPWAHVDPPGWFGAADWARPGLILQGLWGAGGGMILWLAGLQGIPQHLYEAAEIDGAGFWSKFRNVTIPMLSPYIFFNLVMGLIQTIQEFDRIYILGKQGAGGSTVGPVDSLLVPVLHLFNNAFKYFKMGYASALAWVLFLIILGLTLVQLKLAPRWVHYEADRK